VWELSVPISFEQNQGATKMEKSDHMSGMKIAIERKVLDHSMSGYNLQNKPDVQSERESYMRMKEGEVASRDSIQPDGSCGK
jgi:hypothetical protein